MKKKRVYISAVIILFTGLMIAISGCNTKKAGNEFSAKDKGSITESRKKGSNNNKEKSEIKVSELFNKSEKRLWYYTHEMAYNEDVEAIYIVEEGNVTTYRFYYGDGKAHWQPTFEELDKMTDDEIIKYVAEKVEPINEKVDIEYRRDSTGNKIQEEIIRIGEGTLSNRFNIGRIIEGETILSNQFCGFENVRGESYLITKNNFADNTQIILNEIDDEGLIEK
ncbi:hypothetical protein CE91St62_00950 [Lachnospiraceae bacterium]|uniref:hypothetical protein n=1 Tax=Extibacter sp. GGCC_0201 TaxID=2731209 RepID=UPI001AA0CEDD|nr:hypothetical protein [Extibacter sp. GGCC_0201]MBO1720919.1 hypothetical protein [Extibacter sp. GGCC_0201]BDF32021.1 hypothetical protein CE91St61_00960 [Lachnospiraceae bacterium]BDF36034.1 hypothetical protein CE91St62_00950 [Lachnospiraceae bacterium]